MTEEPRLSPIRPRIWLAGLGLAVIALFALSAVADRRTEAQSADKAADKSADSFTPAQEAEIERLIRQYILEHPEILPEAIQILQAREAAAERKRLEVAASEHAETIAYDGFSPVIGPEDAPVTVVEFYDYRCPYCKVAYRDTARLLEEHEGKVRYVFKQIPVLDRPGSEPVSRMAARAAVAAARQQAFPAFHEALMTARGGLNEARIFSLAEDAGLNVERLQRDMRDPAVEAYIDNTLRLAQSIGITGTPTYIINGRILQGAQGYEAMSALLEDSEEAAGGE